MTEQVLVAWSGGKDSAMALDRLLQSEEVEIAALLTTVTDGYDRISMHGVRQTLLEQQVEALGYPLERVVIPQECSDEQYGELMRTALLSYRQRGVDRVVFGDLFLEDVRAYREDRLKQVEMQPIFPVWGVDTAELAASFFERGFRAIVTCVDTAQLDGEFAGREYDPQFVADLPDGVDPCGENGEFHSFVYDGPLFSQPIAVTRGERVLREDQFYFCDLLPANQA